MKKIIALCLSLVLGLGMVLPVSAAVSSPEADDVVSIIDGVDADGNNFSFKLEKVEADDDLAPEADDDTVIGQYSFIAGEDIEYPATITLDVVGVKAGDTVYVMVKDAAGKVSQIEATVDEDGVVVFELEKEYTTLSLVAAAEADEDADKDDNQVGTSDKTGNETAVFVAFVMLISAACVVVAKKRVNN